MSITIDATVGGASSNSFVTEVEQIAFMATRANASNWTTITGSTCTENEKRALVMASRRLSYMTWKGRRVTTTQALSWPRWNVINPDAAFGNYLYETTVIPQRVKDACCELAFQYLNQGTTDLAVADPNAGVTEKTIDVITTRWDVHQRVTGLSRFADVMVPLKPLLCGSASQTDLVRG